MRGVIEGIDVRDPAHRSARPFNSTVPIRPRSPRSYAGSIRGAHRRCAQRTLLIEAKPADLTQIKTLIAAIDTPPATPAPSAVPVDALRVTRAAPRDVARAIATSSAAFEQAWPGSRSSSAAHRRGRESEGARRTDRSAVERRALHANLPAALRRRAVGREPAFAFAPRCRDHDRRRPQRSLGSRGAGRANSASPTRLRNSMRAARSAGPAGPTGGSTESGGGGAEVISLRAAAPGLNGAPSSSATDIATTVTQALQSQVPDPTHHRPAQQHAARPYRQPVCDPARQGLIDQLDVEQKLVVLDTEILEVDENAAKNLGLSFSTPVLSTTLNETDAERANGGTPPPFLNFQALTRTPLSFGVNLNLLIQSGKGDAGRSAHHHDFPGGPRRSAPATTSRSSRLPAEAPAPSQPRSCRHFRRA